MLDEVRERGDSILFMKVGVHAQESLESIIRRKRQEIADSGFSMWGYGGNVCHPLTMVQPFAAEKAAQGHEIVLCMQPMASNHRHPQVRAQQYSVDGISWETIDPGINVLGSRYALCLGEIRDVDEILHLGSTRVAVGRSAGRLGSDYVGGRVDKACLDLVDDGVESPPLDIKFLAPLVPPYAVFLRNPPSVVNP
ncbi:MAG: hypothetical protein U0Q22_18885 [Acidimicrobiales bacterium]